MVVFAQAPAELARARMMAALDQQRESVRKQARSLNLYQKEEAGFYFTPWPKQIESDASAPKVNPASYRPQAFSAAPICDPIAPARLESMIADTARNQGVEEKLLRAVVRKESAGVPCAVSPVGALGLMQLMPATAAAAGVNEPFEPRQNLEAGARLLRQLLERYGGDLSLALSAYNAGPGAVDQYQGVPPYSETRNYVADILKQLRIE